MRKIRAAAISSEWRRLYLVQNCFTVVPLRDYVLFLYTCRVPENSAEVALKRCCLCLFTKELLEAVCVRVCVCMLVHGGRTHMYTRMCA